MDNKAYFFSGIDNFEMLVSRTREAIIKGYVSQKYKILDAIKLNDVRFTSFLENLSGKHDFLHSISANLKVSNEGEYLCLAVINDYYEAMVLVCTLQYSYPKYMAVVRRNGCGK